MKAKKIEQYPEGWITLPEYKIENKELTMSKNVAEAINAIEKVLKESKWSCCTIHSVLTKEECDVVAKNILSKNKWIKEFFADEIATCEGHCMEFTWKRVVNNHMILFWCGINHYEYSRDEIMLASE